MCLFTRSSGESPLNQLACGRKSLKKKERYPPAIFFMGATLLLKILYGGLSATVPKGEPQKDVFLDLQPLALKIYGGRRTFCIKDLNILSGQLWPIIKQAGA